VPHSRLALAQSQFVKKPADVIAIVVDGKLGLNYGRHARRGPMIVGETVRHGTVAINLRHAVQLLPGQAAGPAGSFAALQ